MIGLAPGLIAAARRRQSNPYFETVWKTDNAGTSNDDQITLPLFATTTYDATVAWGDGTTSALAGTGEVIGAGATHTYAAAGTYTVRISGVFPRIVFNDGGDKLKILQLRNWGDIQWMTFGSAFYGCTNLEITANDVPRPSTISGKFISFDKAFRLIAAVNSKVALWGSPGLTGSDEWALREMFYAVTGGVNYNLNTWDTAGAQRFGGALRNLGNMPNLRCDKWDFESSLGFGDFLLHTTLSTQNYDRLLISLASQAVNPDLVFHGGSSKYSGDPAGDPATSGAAARAKLLLPVVDGGKGWTSITDGGAL